MKYLKPYKIKLATLVEGHSKAPFSIATTTKVGESLICLCLPQRRFDTRSMIQKSIIVVI